MESTVEEAQAEYLSRIQHHVHEKGHISLPPQKRDEPDEDDEIRNYASTFLLNQATRSRAATSRFAVCIAYLMPNNVVGLATAREFRTRDINPLAIMFAPRQIDDMVPANRNATMNASPTFLIRPLPKDVDEQTIATAKTRREAAMSVLRKMARSLSDYDLEKCGSHGDKTAVASPTISLSTSTTAPLNDATADPATSSSTTHQSTQDKQAIVKWLYEQVRATKDPRRTRSVPSLLDLRDEDIKEAARGNILFANTQLAERVARGKKLIVPTDTDILKEAAKVEYTNAYYEGHIGIAKQNGFRRHFKWSLGWDVSQKRIATVLSQKTSIVSFGEIPVHVGDFSDERDAADKLEIFKLPNHREPEEKTKPDKDFMAEQKIEKQMKRRPVKRRPNFFELHAQPPPKQVEEVRTTAFFKYNPEVASHITLRHEFCYIDETRPGDQPSTSADVHLNFRNARCKGDTPDKDKDVYFPSHRIVEIGDEHCDMLEKIFGHKDKTYFNTLRTTLVEGNQLYLVSFHHNELPYTSNLFRHAADVTPACKDLQIAMRSSPVIMMLVRTNDLARPIEPIVKDWQSLASYNPLVECFVDIDQQFVNNKSIVPTERLPKITVPMRLTFDDRLDYRMFHGIAALVEERWASGSMRYTGLAAAIPIPRSYSPIVKLPMVYNLAFTPDMDSRTQPQLMPGDPVLVTFACPDDAVHSVAWKGRISEANASTGLGQVSIMIHRPMVKGQPLTSSTAQDNTDLSSLTLKELDVLTPGQLQAWSRANTKIRVNVVVKKPSNETKRKMDGFAALEVPQKKISDHEEHKNKQEQLDGLWRFLLANDHQSLSSSDLWEDIRRYPLYDKAIKFVFSRLLPFQAAPVQKWKNGGVYEGIAMLTGASGSGKTFTGIHVALLFTLEVHVNPDKQASNLLDVTEIFPNAAVPMEGQEPPKPLRFQKDWQFDSTKNPLENPLENPETYEHGRITLTACQNETVDDMYQKASQYADEFTTALGLPKKLVVRVHSLNTETAAVLSMIHPDFEYGPEKSFIFFDDASSQGSSVVGQELLSSYCDQYSAARYRGIRDRRFKEKDGSVAACVLRLAGFPGYDMIEALKSLFSDRERQKIKAVLRPLIDAHFVYAQDKDITPELNKAVVKSACEGYRLLLSRLPIVVTTLSVAANRAFSLFRQHHFVMLEEAGRANHADSLGLLSHSPFINTALFIGDHKQLPPSMFGPKTGNPFHDFGYLSMLSTAYLTGFYVPELLQTRRFQNKLLLKLALIVNERPEMEMVYGSESVKETQAAASLNNAIWRKESPLLWINVFEGQSLRAKGGSYCSRDTALVTMHHLVKQCAVFDGRQQAVISPYKAQVDLLKKLVKLAQKNAEHNRDLTLARNLQAVEISTVDGFMGREKDRVILDMTTHIGFIKDLRRTLVTFTRGKVAQIIIGDSRIMTGSGNGIADDHPMKILVRWLGQERLITCIEKD
ncbi:hypothetical protein B0J11DRAFT_509685 [Dendryphion nanum]|uniref:DNA2/NAM7 helicase-like C-terminal domain-containing protein n=1 Tax=Dendryphion nanum TaxID=256645 RepID=A0A9P9IDT5_9PLEO|nr:hypothetical protein B0J11DRAFT_509685 [Dendryphion nanum]